MDISTWNLVITREQNFDGETLQLEAGFLDPIRTVTIILPVTQAPFNHGTGNDGKNVKNLDKLFFVLCTGKVEEIRVQNLWPRNGLELFRGFLGMSADEIKQACPALKLIDLGFLGYNVLDKVEDMDLLDLIAQGGFCHLKRLEWRTRNGVDDWIREDRAKVLLTRHSSFHNVYWEGWNLSKYIVQAALNK